AAVAHSRACPEAAPTIVIEELRRTGVSLVEGWDNALPRHQGFVSGKSAGDRPVEVCLLDCVLEAPRDAKVLQLFHVQHQLSAFRAGRVEVDGNENARDRDFVILEGITPAM